jgi:hypothetical protein
MKLTGGTLKPPYIPTFRMSPTGQSPGGAHFILVTPTIFQAKIINNMHINGNEELHISNLSRK